MLQDDGLACYGGGSGSSFVGIESSFLYWSGSADEADPGKAFVYDMVDGDLLTDFKAASHVIWPVRDPGSPGGPDGEVMVGTTYIDTRQDGPCQNLLGVGSERYVDCGNGTVLDLATGLIWVADPSCLSLPFALAIQGTSSFADGFCGLTDGSQPGDWRLPTPAGIKSPPALTNTTGGDCLSAGPSPFSDDVEDFYWSATANLDKAVVFNTNTGAIGPISKSNVYGVWPVRKR